MRIKTYIANQPIRFIGTTHRCCFYMRLGTYCLRAASSLTGKRVKKDKRFARTMANAKVLGRASQIGSRIYQLLPECFREGWMYRAFTGEAVKLLRSGQTDEQTYEALWQVYVSVHAAKEQNAIAIQETNKTEISNSRLRIASRKQSSTNKTHKAHPSLQLFLHSPPAV